MSLWSGLKRVSVGANHGSNFGCGAFKVIANGVKLNGASGLGAVFQIKNFEPSNFGPVKAEEDAVAVFAMVSRHYL